MEQRNLMKHALILGILACVATQAQQSYGLTIGKADMLSAGALAFGPGGILFVGDSLSGAVFAFDTGGRSAAAASDVSIEGIDKKVAAALGVASTDVQFHDVKVHPISKSVYLSVSRGRGPDAIPVLIRVDAAGTISELATDRIAHARVALPGVPKDPRSRHRNPKMLVITEMAYAEGKLVVAGLSNEDFSSTLHLIPFPFGNADAGAQVEIYHTSHLTWETSSPVRTLVPYRIGGESYLLAAYTCTPLVKLRMADLKTGARVQGETLAELGRHSSPLDMIHYRKQGHDRLLVANTARGALRLDIDDLASFGAVTSEGGDESQIPMRKVAGWKGVLQLDLFDESRALVLLDQPDRLDLKTVPLP